MVNGRTSGAMRQVARMFQQGTLAGLPDGEILGRFVVDRDEAAFEALLGRHGPMVLNVCRQILRDPDDAEDAFQATFLALASKASSLRIGDSLGPWLYRVANRVAARARADRRRRGDRERSSGPLPEPACSRAEGFDEIPRVVHEELDRLPERLRAPIVLCYLEGMTHDRAARQLRCPVGTVRSRLARARALLQGRIARRGVVTSSVSLGAVLSTTSRASASPHVPRSLVKVAARLAAGSARLSGEAGVPASVAALLEGVLNVLRAKQLASAMAALAAVGLVVTVVGLSVFSASGQTGDGGESRAVSKPAHPRRVQDLDKSAPETIVKTYYVGDLILPTRSVDQPATARGPADRRSVDMAPVVDLIASTVARGTWTIRDASGEEITPGGEPVKRRPGEPRSEKVGAITPFFLSISLIVRHTPEVHEEVADLLRKVRRLIDPPAMIEDEKRLDTPGDSKRVPPALPSPPDPNDRIRQLLEELRHEVDKLPKR